MQGDPSSYVTSLWPILSPQARQDANTQLQGNGFTTTAPVDYSSPAPPVYQAPTPQPVAPQAVKSATSNFVDTNYPVLLGVGVAAALLLFWGAHK